MANRVETREGIPLGSRMRLAEADLDSVDAKLDDIRSGQRTTNQRLILVLVATLTVVLTLGANIVVNLVNGSG